MLHLHQRLSQLNQSVLNRVRGTRSFDGILTLEQLHGRLSQLRFRPPSRRIGGWMSFDEQRVLYALARISSSPILEVGPWLGLSTVCIARGVVDSGASKEFLTCELAPTLSNFRLIDDHSVGFYYPEESQIAMGVCSKELFDRDIKPVLERPLGLLGQLKNNLNKAAVSEVVSVFVGDFRLSPEKRYALVFTDSMHDANEIERNAPDLKRFMGPGSILACHDTSEANRKTLEKHFTFRYSFTVDSLFVGAVAADGLRI